MKSSMVTMAVAEPEMVTEARAEAGPGGGAIVRTIRCFRMRPSDESKCEDETGTSTEARVERQRDTIKTQPTTALRQQQQ